MKTMYFVLKILIVLLLIIATVSISGFIYYKSNCNIINANLKNENMLVLNNNQIEENINKVKVESGNVIVELPGEKIEIITEIDDWRLVLVNSENSLPENFTIELAKIDGSKEFDARAIDELLRNDSGNERFWCF